MSEDEGGVEYERDTDVERRSDVSRVTPVISCFSRFSVNKRRAYVPCPEF